MLAKFYGDVLPRSGFLALFLGGTKQHVWARTVEELAFLTEERADVVDVYFATGSFREPVNRKAENAHKFRAFRLDIDGGEVKYAKYGDAVYRTQQDALAALISFTRSAELVPSFVVSSGAGLHVYYCLDEDVDAADWVPVARQLQVVAVRQGLKVDSKVTSDTARVLRPPGSLHYSGARVQVLRDTGFKYTLKDFVGRVGIAPATAKYDLSVNREILDDDFQGPPKSVAKIIKHCAAMAHATTEINIPEPMWRAMLGLTKHTQEGDEAAHRFSEDYPDYDWEETQKKLDNWSAGPTTCHEFSQHFPGCHDCPHWGKIKSPIMLGVLNTEEVAQLPPEQQPVLEVPESPRGFPWDDQLTDPYFVSHDDHAFTLNTKTRVTIKDEFGDDAQAIVTVPITSTVFWLGTWAEAADSNDTAVVTLHVWNGSHERVYTMDQSLLASQTDTLKFLAGKAIHARNQPGARKAMEDYIKAQLERIRTMHMRPKINDRFGLRIEPDGSMTCAHGKYVIHADGEIVEAMLGANTSMHAGSFEIAALRDWPGPKWKPDVWGSIRQRAAQYVDFVRRFYGEPDLRKFQLAIMFLLASPLMAFVTGRYTRGAILPPNGLTVSLYSSESSRGKTSAAKVGMAAFGDPEVLVRVRDKASSTENARRGMLSVHGTMPVVMDEMGRSADAEMIAAIISGVANGAAKERRDTKYGTETPWALINVMTSNKSQRDLISLVQAESAAIQLRLLELDVDRVPNRSREVLQAWDEEYPVMASECAGALGALLGLAFCRQGVEKMNERVMRCVKKASEAVDNSQEARFQWRAFGAVLAVQEILEQLGLAMFDTELLTRTFVEAFRAGGEYIEDAVLPADGVALIGIALNDLKPETLITDTETHRGHNPHARDMVLNLGGPPRKVVARHVQKGGYTYVSREALVEWCVRRGVTLNRMIKDCQNARVLELMTKTSHRGTIDLFKGTGEDGVSAPTIAYKVNVRALQGHAVEYGDKIVAMPVKPPRPDEPLAYDQNEKHSAD